MRIAKFISLAGICSRRQAEKLIEERNVSVNGELILSPALNIDPDLDSVVCNNQNVNDLYKTYAKCQKLWIYYKPVGLVCTHKDEKNRKNIFDDLKNKIDQRVISIGRLDLNSEGLLLLTNSGELADYMTSPKNKIERIYKVRVFNKNNSHSSLNDLNIKNQIIKVDNINYNVKLIRSLNLHKKKEKNKEKNNWYYVVLTEGKNREIRKIFNHFNFEVNRLIRVSYGDYALGSLKPGQVKEIKVGKV